MTGSTTKRILVPTAVLLTIFAVACGGSSGLTGVESIEVAPILPEEPEDLPCYPSIEDPRYLEKLLERRLEEPPADHPPEGEEPVEGPEGFKETPGPFHNFAVINSSQIDVCFLYVSPIATNSWGKSQLEGTPISPGDSRKFVLENGYYDLLAEDCNYNLMDAVHNIPISALGCYTWEITFGSETLVPVHVVNRTDRPICTLLTSPVSADFWSRNRLLVDSDINPLDPGDKFELALPSGTYNLAALDCRDQVVDIREGVFIILPYIWDIGQTDFDR